MRWDRCEYTLQHREFTSRRQVSARPALGLLLYSLHNSSEEIFFLPTKMLRQFEVLSNTSFLLDLQLIFMAFFKDPCALAENVTVDLLGLIVWPDASSYCFKIETKAELLSSLALMENIVSSAKRR